MATGRGVLVSKTQNHVRVLETERKRSRMDRSAARVAHKHVGPYWPVICSVYFCNKFAYSTCSSGAHARIMYSVCYLDRHAGKPGTICSAAMSREYLEAENLKPGKMMAKAWQSTQAYRIGNEMIMSRL